MQVYVLMPSWHRPPLLHGSEKGRNIISHLHALNSGLICIKFKNRILTGFAVISVNLTLEASVTRLAKALVTTHCVMTNGSIATWAFHTLIDVNLTCLTLKEKRDKVNITFQMQIKNRYRQGFTKQDRYLAILRGRYRKSSGSLQPLYTLLHFYRVWGCRVQVRSHSFHLVTEKTSAFRFPVFLNS